MFTPFQFDELEIERNNQSVTLNEGDIMYHPAGIWHSVFSDEDSIAINISLKNITMADLISDSL